MGCARFYNGKWQDGKRKYRFKNKPENPVVVLRDILRQSGYEIDKEMDELLGKLYRYAEGKK